MDRENKKEERTYMAPAMISNWEAALLMRLRRYAFGTWTIVKTDGQPRRIVEGGSAMLDSEEGREIFEN